MGILASQSKKNKSSSSVSTLTSTSAQQAAIAQVQQAKKKAGLKSRAGQEKQNVDGPILGGADYVDLMMGSRRKARVEAEKLPTR
jgi:hypothetical protein